MGRSEGTRRGQSVLRYGMHVFDVHDQMLGTVLLVRKEHFVLRQEVGLNQIVLLSNAAISGVVAGLVFLTMTPGEISQFGTVLERRERESGNFSLQPRLASRLALAEAV